MRAIDGVISRMQAQVGAPGSGAALTAPAGAAAPAPPSSANGADIGPIAVELVATDALELGAVQALGARAGLPLVVRGIEPDAAVELDRVDRPVERRSEALVKVRDDLLDQLRAGTGDPRELVRKLDGLSVLIDIVRRHEEKRAFMKKLLKQLMLGSITPETIRLAKQFGLARFLKDAILEIAKRGMFSPQALKAVAGMMQEAGIPMPQIDDMVIRWDRRVAAQVNADRVARGQAPVDVAGASGASGAALGVQALQGDTSALS